MVLLMVFSFRVGWRGIAPVMETTKPGLEAFPVNPRRAACSVSEKQSRLRACQRNAICLFGGAVDGESCRVIVFPSLALIAFRVQSKTGKNA